MGMKYDDYEDSWLTRAWQVLLVIFKEQSVEQQWKHLRSEYNEKVE